MHGLKYQKTAFVYVSQIIVRVQAIEEPHNQIIVRVRTCGPHGIDTYNFTFTVNNLPVDPLWTR